MNKATLIKDKLDSFNGHASVYKLTPPLDGHAFVVVSSVEAYSGPETYIFPSDEYGDIVDWLEMSGSYRGGLDHKEALRGAGYQVS